MISAKEEKQGRDRSQRWGRASGAALESRPDDGEPGLEGPPEGSMPGSGKSNAKEVSQEKPNKRRVLGHTSHSF